MTERAWAEINLSHIEHNFEYFRSNVRVNKIMAVVKANAYGHGACRVAKLLQDEADCFGVANVEEGVELHQEGISKPIVVLGSSWGEELAAAIERDIVLTVSSVEQAKCVDKAAQSLGRIAKIYLAINMGFNRLGMDFDDALEQNITQISRLFRVEIVGVFSHNNKPNIYQKVDTYRQNARLVQVVGALIAKGQNIRELSTCATSTCLDSDLVVGNMVRVGLGLYGYGQPHLLPSMSVYSRVVYIRNVGKGERIGYSPSYIACKNMKIAVLSIGYADGYNLAMSDLGYVLIADKFAKVVGKICMDMCMVDITDIAGVQDGDIAVMWNERARLDEMLSVSTTSVYEMLSTLGRRVKKRYIG